MVKAKESVVRLVLAEAEVTSGRRAQSLQSLAVRLELLSGSHPLVHVLNQERDLPTDALFALIHQYGAEDEADPERFFAALAELVEPGAGAEVTAAASTRPPWIIFSPGAFVAHAVWSRKKRCPDCGTRISREARLCRYCGCRFGE